MYKDWAIFITFFFYKFHYKEWVVRCQKVSFCMTLKAITKAGISETFGGLCFIVYDQYIFSLYSVTFIASNVVDDATKCLFPWL